MFRKVHDGVCAKTTSLKCKTVNVYLSLSFRFLELPLSSVSVDLVTTAESVENR